MLQNTAPPLTLSTSNISCTIYLALLPSPLRPFLPSRPKLCNSHPISIALSPPFPSSIFLPSAPNFPYSSLSFQINAAAEVIYEAVDPNANIIFGALVDESMNGEIAITVIATGFPVMSTADALSGYRHTRESCHDKSYNSSMFRYLSDFSPTRMCIYDHFMYAFSLASPCLVLY